MTTCIPCRVSAALSLMIVVHLMLLAEVSR